MIFASLIIILLGFGAFHVSKKWLNLIKEGKYSKAKSIFIYIIMTLFWLIYISLIIGISNDMTSDDKLAVIMIWGIGFTAYLIQKIGAEINNKLDLIQERISRLED